MVFKQGPNGIPIFRRSWVISDAPIRKNRVLENKAGDSRLWDPTDTGILVEYANTCRTSSGRFYQLSDTVAPGDETRCQTMSIGTIK